jgi:hypothetical protein
VGERGRRSRPTAGQSRTKNQHGSTYIPHPSPPGTTHRVSAPAAVSRPRPPLSPLGQVQVTGLGYQCIGSMNDILPWFIPRMRRSVVVAKVLITARPATRSTMYRSRSKTSPHLQADWSRNIYAGVPSLFLAVAEVGIGGRREGPRRTPWPAHQGDKLLMNGPPLSLELRS